MVHERYAEAKVALDQDSRVFLTRERFSGCMKLRIGAPNNKDSFKHLGPFTFEWFQMLMALLQLIFHKLYHEDSVQDLGTIKAEQCRISRENIKSDVKNTYDACRDFSVSFIDSYIVEANLEHFGMNTVYSTPTKNLPPADATDPEKWMLSEFEQLVQHSVWPSKGCYPAHKAPDVSGKSIKRAAE